MRTDAWRNIKITFILGIIICAVFGGITYGEDERRDLNSKWYKISDAYYEDISPQMIESVVLRRIPQNIDYELIMEDLVDDTIAPDIAAVENVKNDPNASLPDNMLPDGRVLKENWRELQEEIIREMKVPRYFNGGVAQKVDEKKVIVSFGEREEDLKEVTIEGEKYIYLGDSAKKIDTISERNETILSHRKGIYLIDPYTKTAKEIMPQTYGGKTYEELNSEAIASGNDGITWNGQVQLNPKGNKLAYVSEKDNLKTLSVFMYDLEEEKEVLVAGSEDDDYLIVGWIDENTVICYRLNGKEVDLVSINESGRVNNLGLETKEVHVIDVRENLLAYFDSACRNIWVTWFENGEIVDVLHIPIEQGIVVLMPDDDAFNPSGNKLAFIYKANDGGRRYIWTVDLFSKEVSKDLTLPPIDEEKIGVYRFSWINDDEMIVNIFADRDNKETISTWKYTL
ncbi:MAG: hypothetical protein IJ486_04715 [Firmicutes bacterium]|nr:hypothetical protein [Bacillota bacterium]